mmetsp:Transcript_6459/g.11905  ORF Transcript_6459/g.11905 Transcript_6459/m.11905 type:complete len:256 (+) Transcript_6459:101-868(+)
MRIFASGVAWLYLQLVASQFSFQQGQKLTTQHRAAPNLAQAHAHARSAAAVASPRAVELPFAPSCPGARSASGIAGSAGRLCGVAASDLGSPSPKRRGEKGRGRVCVGAEEGEIPLDTDFKKDKDDLIRFTAVKPGGLRLYVVYFFIGKGWIVEDESEGRVWATLKTEQNEIKGNLLIGVHCEGESGSAGSLRVRRLADPTRPYMLKEGVALKSLIEELESINEDKSIPNEKRLFALHDKDELTKAKETVMASLV